ncbi:MAG: calcium/sodium antiporter [Legionellales bacterium]|nr:calcium/sodium antiporter [Legionellales bacterium]
MSINFIFLIAGLGIITWAADKFVDGAASISHIMGVSPLLVGLTIVAVGTSAPEIFVAISSAFNGNVGLAVGNALGSNITNVALVLGACAAINPIKVHSKLLKREYPILFFTTFLLWMLLRDNHLSIFDGLILLIGCLLLLMWFIKEGLRRNQDRLAQEYQEELSSKLSLKKSIFFLILGILLLPISSHIIVKNAVAIAKYLNISDLIIGLTIVAFGTSLPEIITAVVASIKKENDILIGNIIGSNLFNILAVLPFPAFIRPGPLDNDIQRDIMMICFTTILLFLFAFGLNNQGRISRIEGVFLVTTYIFYIAYLILPLY